MEKKKEMNLIESFEFAKEMGELKALSNLSLEQPLSNKQYKRMLDLAKKLNIIGNEGIFKKG